MLNNYEQTLINTLKELLENNSTSILGQKNKYCSEIKTKEKYIEILKNNVACMENVNFNSKKLLQDLYAVLLNAFYDNKI